MKTLRMNKMKTSLLGLIAVAAFLSACQKNNNSTPPVAAAAPVCAYGQVTGCTGIVGTGVGQVLYSATTTQGPYQMQMAQFQVSIVGNGMASIQGSLTFLTQTPYYCGFNAFPPQVQIPFSSQQGTLFAGDAFQGIVTLQGGQGMAQAEVQVIPVRPGLPGLFRIYIQGCPSIMEMNF